MACAYCLSTHRNTEAQPPSPIARFLFMSKNFSISLPRLFTVSVFALTPPEDDFILVFAQLACTKRLVTISDTELSHVRREWQNGKTLCSSSSLSKLKSDPSSSLSTSW